MGTQIELVEKATGSELLEVECASQFKLFML